MNTRKPNSGPYVVTWTTRTIEEGKVVTVPVNTECHTWKETTEFIRHLLIEGEEVIGVKFA